MQNKYNINIVSKYNDKKGIRYLILFQNEILEKFLIYFLKKSSTLFPLPACGERARVRGFKKKI